VRIDSQNTSLRVLASLRALARFIDEQTRAG